MCSKREEDTPAAAKSRSCACCNIAMETISTLVFAFLQFVVWATMFLMCHGGYSGGYYYMSTMKEGTYAETCASMSSSPPSSGMCSEEWITNGDGMIKHAKNFCNAQSGIMAISIIAIVLSLCLIWFAISMAGCCCGGCCGKTAKARNQVYAIVTAIAALIALVRMIMYAGALSESEAYNKKFESFTGYKNTFATGSAYTYAFFHTALLLVTLFAAGLVLSRGGQSALSVMVVREKTDNKDKAQVVPGGDV